MAPEAEIKKRSILKSTITLAVDVEMSGARFSEHDVLAIGAAVVDERFELLDTFFYKSYNPTDATFETRCWDEFWSKHENIFESVVKAACQGATHGEIVKCLRNELGFGEPLIVP